MLEPTSGTITIEGLDSCQHIQDVRKVLGFCPQYGTMIFSINHLTSAIFFYVLDILYDELSVQEHLELVAQVKPVKFYRSYSSI